MRRNTPILSAFALVGALGLGACDLDVPAQNDPELDELAENPTVEAVVGACTGLQIGSRTGTAAANGYVLQLGVLGREAYNLDNAEPRFVTELLAGSLSPSSAFGGNFWSPPYRNMRLGDLTIAGAEKLDAFDDTQKAAIRGFVRTIRALDLLRVISTRDDIGAVIDTSISFEELSEGKLAPIVPREEVYAEIARLLDEAAGDLAAGGDGFPFVLSPGYAGFDTPATFRTFNRGLRARTAAYQADYATALAVLPQSFLNEAAATVEELEVGPAHAYSTNTGDITNDLASKPIYAHPSLETDAQLNGEVPDARFARKVTKVTELGSSQDLTSDLKFTRYHPTAPVPILRVEELILLRAEARWGTNDLAGAKADLDLIRTVSGGLAPMAETPTADELLAELLYNRRYSLMFEGGHRWIDARRMGMMDTIPLDDPGHQRNVRYPLPTAECDARLDEPACDMTSAE